LFYFDSMNSPFIVGKPKKWLQLDGLVLFISTIILFASTHHHWWIYPVLLFVPDIFMVGYLKDSKLGAFLYNVGHSYLAPTLLTFFGWNQKNSLLIAIGVIWLGHIGWDRFFGYGLKYDSRFKDTHLGNLDKNQSNKN